MERSLFVFFFAAVLLCIRLPAAQAVGNVEAQFGRALGKGNVFIVSVADGWLPSFYLGDAVTPRLHIGYLERAQGGYTFGGVDFVVNAFVKQDPPSPFTQFGIGFSYFPHLTENLGSNVELHLFAKWGFMNPAFGCFYGYDHFSNGGLTERNTGEDILSIGCRAEW